MLMWKSWQRLCIALALALLLNAVYAAPPRVMLHAPLDGNAMVELRVGAAEGRLLPSARFVPGRGGQGQALLSTTEPPPPAKLLFPPDFFGFTTTSSAAATPEAGDPAKLAAAQLAAGRPDTSAVVLPLAGHYDPRRGTLSFWFQPQHGIGRSLARQFDLISSSGGRGPAVAFGSARGEVTLRPTVLDAGGSLDDATCTFKYLHPGKWYHFALTWDAEAGAITAWMYGRPLAGGTMPTSASMALAEELTIGCSDFAIDELRIYDRALIGEELRAEAGLQPGDAMTDEGIVEPATQVDVAELRGKLLWADDFSSSASLGEWVMEGPGQAAIVDGKLRLSTAGNAGQGHIVYWNKRELPADFVAEWTFTPAAEGGLCIVFFAARGRDGESIFDATQPLREGLFARYYGGAIDCYQVSYFRNSGAAQPECMLRKHYGFHLLAMGPDRTEREPGARNTITLVKRAGRILFFTNGKLALDAVDDGMTHGPVLGTGNLGWRQMGHTRRCDYDDFRVYACKP